MTIDVYLRLSFVTLAFALAFGVFGCGGGGSKEDDLPVEQAATEEPAEPPRPVEYVIVHRNTPIRLAPDDDAPFLQYRPPDRQHEFDERRAEADKERAEKQAEADAERREREKKRRDNIRKRRKKLSWKRRKELRERDAERAEQRRTQRAERKLRDIRSRAQRDRIEGPDRPWIPFQLVGEKGDWLELSPVHRTDDPPHCYARNFGEVDRLAATFWVRRDDVASVTTSRVRVPVADGTEVILLPGVVVEKAGETSHRVYVDGFVLELDVPPDSIGTTYRPTLPFEAPMTDTVFTPIALAHGKLRFERSAPLPYNPYRQLYVTGTLYVGSRFYVTTQTPCGEYTVRASEELVEPVGRRGAMRLTPDTDSVSPPLAKEGSTAFMPDGREFARVRAAFPLGAHTTDVDGRKCFRSAVWGDSDAAVSRSLELCFAPEDLVLEE